jgi:hypothetical protein
MKLKQNRHMKDPDNKSSSSSEIISCPAKGNGDMDDDVSDRIG